MKSGAGSESHSRGGWIWLLLSIVVIGLDQWTKAIAVSELSYAVPVPVLPGLNWTLVHNYGGAFSFLSDHAGWQRWFFLVLASGITLALLEWLRKTPARAWALCLPLSLLVGGAIGNLIDRVHLGYVVDFIDAYYQTSHWPAFNLADSAITAGIALLVAYEVFGARQTKAEG